MSNKKKKKTKKKHTSKTKLLDVIENEPLSKAIRCYFDINDCTKTKAVEYGLGLKIIDIDISTLVGKQLTEKANISNDSEWILTQLDEQNVSTEKYRIIMLDIGQKLKKKGKYKLNLYHHQRKKRISKNMNEYLNMFMTGYLRKHWLPNYDIVPFALLIAKYCGIPSKLAGYPWFEISCILSVNKTVMIMKCNILNRRILNKFIGQKYKKSNSLNNIFVAIKNNKNNRMKLMSFKDVNGKQLQQIFEFVKSGRFKRKGDYLAYTFYNDGKKRFKCVYDEKITNSEYTMFGCFDSICRYDMTVDIKKYIFETHSRCFTERDN